MSHSVTCYPSPGKAKAFLLCEAFAAGAGGRICDPRKGLQPGAAFFYGIVDTTFPLWQQAWAEGRDVYYADNSYFDRGRQAFFRVTKNAFQFTGTAEPDYKRMDFFGIKIKPWREDGVHVVVCEQSEAFMKLCGYSGDWLRETCHELTKNTTRELRIRRWSRDKGKLMATLKGDLENAWALVTHMSAAANEALVNGIPVFTTSELGAASRVSSGGLQDIESPALPGGRSEWAAQLVTQQWSLPEITTGFCWRKLNE